MAALDTNVLLRFLLQDDTAQSALATQLIRRARDTGEALFVPLSVTLELEWVLRSRFDLDKVAVAQTFAALLQTVELRFQDTGALEWALSSFEDSAANFADCIHAALALQAGEQPLWTFDRSASKLEGAQRLS